jgi:[NiFe] hydrogenase diaphorase moiety large subunit
VHRAVDAWGREPTQLLQVLRETQESLGYLPPGALERVSDALGVSIARVRGVVAFYSFLYAEPQGEYRVLFSDNVTDRMRGSEERLRELASGCGSSPARSRRTASSASAARPRSASTTTPPGCS